MNYYPPRCPLCPQIAQYNAQQMGLHLSRTHQLENSALILARAMWTSQLGYQQVMEVLKDVAEMNKRLLLAQKKVEGMKATKLSQTDPKCVSEKNEDRKHG